MGRPYLPSTHSLTRAFGYPGGAFPEAITCIGFQPPTPPSPPPMFDPTGIILYFAELWEPDAPNSGPFVRYARRWETGETWCYIPSLGVDVPGSGLCEYIVRYWSRNFDPDGEPPRAAVIETTLLFHWDFAFSLPWTYRTIWGTLTGLPGRVGWNIPLYAQGVAFPPCTITPWAIGWNGLDMGPATWSQVSDQSFYDPLDVWSP